MPKQKPQLSHAEIFRQEVGVPHTHPNAVELAHNRFIELIGTVQMEKSMIRVQDGAGAYRKRSMARSNKRKMVRNLSGAQSSLDNLKNAAKALLKMDVSEYDLR